MGVGVIERFDQPHPIGVAIDAEPFQGGQRRGIHDGCGDGVIPTQQMALQLLL
jgi:hypothetical protein